jgi:hypothetical protein
LLCGFLDDVLQSRQSSCEPWPMPRADNSNKIGVANASSAAGKSFITGRLTEV